MTEKKKRGRPRKEAAKIFIVQSDEPAGSEKESEIIQMIQSNPKISEMVEKSLAMGKAPIVTFRDAKPYPDNWVSMSKVDRLAWLTANPR